MAIRKDDPMYYRNKINKLILEAKENRLKVYGAKEERDENNIYVYFEANKHEIWSVKVPINKL